MLSKNQHSKTLWQLRRDKLLRPELLGQTVASICWIASVFVYGIRSGGDWLQLMAASAWLLANISAAMSVPVLAQPDVAPNAADDRALNTNG